MKRRLTVREANAVARELDERVNQSARTALAVAAALALSDEDDSDGPRVLP